MAQRFPGGSPAGGGQDQDSSGSSWDDSNFVLDSAIQESKQDEPQPGPSHQPDKRPTSEFSRILQMNDANALRLYIRKRYREFADCDYYRDELEYIISQYIPGYSPGTTDQPTVLITLLKKILPVKERINLSVNLKEILEGSKLAANVEKHKIRIMDNFADVETENEMLRNEVIRNVNEVERCHTYIAELEAKLEVAMKKLRNYNERMFGQLPEDDARFLAEMERNLKVREDLESSLHDETTRNRNVIDRLSREVTRLKRELMVIDHERIQELAEIAQDIEIDERIKRSLIDKINTLQASTEDCNKAIAEWMSAIHESFNEKKEGIDRTREEVKMLDNEVAKQEAEAQDLAVKRNEVNMEIAALRESIAEEEIEVQSLEHCINQLEEEKQNLTRQADLTYEYLDSILGSTQSQLEEGRQSPVRPSDRSSTAHDFLDKLSSTPNTSPGLFNSDSIPYIDDTGSINIMDSPEQLRRGDSPGYRQDRFDDTYSLSLDPSQDEGIPDIRISPPSPLDLDAAYDIHLPSPIAPGTQTISQPRSGIFPSTSKVNPSTQTIKNRIDVGKSLNMKTVQSGLTSPYRQNTRLESNVPIAGPSRMVDSPFNIKHMADLTPSHFVTPFISTTRFGYTDPKAKVLNLPPGDNYELDTVLKKRLLLTSPQRAEPLLVDIGVQPQPLVQTSSGEHFICDISLDVQQAGKKQPYISPVFTRGAPPAVTPTITRRELAAPFTPKGIFKKKHFNLRRVIGPHYESPGKYFPPHHLPFDSRSPISDIPHYLSKSPCYSDGTISWEKVPGLDSTYDSSMMNRTFDRSASPVMNRTYGESPSPLIKGPSYRFRMQESFTSSDGSQSPVHGRTFDSSSSPISGGTYDSSMSPRLNVTFDRSSSPRSISPRSMSPRSMSPRSMSPRSMSPRRDETFDRSLSPRSEDVYDRSISPRLDATFDSSMSPRSGGTYNRSMSPRSGGTYERSMSPRLDATFDSSMSSRSGGPYDHSTSTRSGGTYDRSMSPRSGGTYERSMSPRLDATFDSSMSSRSGGTYDRNTSPRSGGTYDRSMSPRSGGTYERSMSPRLDATFDSSMSSRSGGPYDHSTSTRSGGTYDSSMSPRSGGTYERSMSPRLDAAFDSSMSPQSGGAHDRSMSPRSGGTYDRSMSPRLDVTFDLSKSSRLDDTHDSSFSSLNRAFIQSPSSEMDESFHGSPSPRLENTFEQSPSRPNKSPYLDDSPQSDDSSRSFGNFPRIKRTHNVSVSPRLNRTYDVSFPYLMDRPFVESPQSNRSFSPQRFNESDQSSLNRTFDTYPSQNSALSDEDWSFDSGYSSYVSNQSGHSERTP